MMPCYVWYVDRIMKPNSDEIEVTIFGLGYGECMVIHIGSGKWAIIDSCVDDSDEPASLTYLRSLGVSVETDVISVSASHWHDDHAPGAVFFYEDQETHVIVCLRLPIRQESDLSTGFDIPSKPVRQ